MAPGANAATLLVRRERDSWCPWTAREGCARRVVPPSLGTRLSRKPPGGCLRGFTGRPRRVCCKVAAAGHISGLASHHTPAPSSFGRRRFARGAGASSREAHDEVCVVSRARPAAWRGDSKRRRPVRPAQPNRSRTPAKARGRGGDTPPCKGLPSSPSPGRTPTAAFLPRTLRAATRRARGLPGPPRSSARRLVRPGVLGAGRLRIPNMSCSGRITPHGATRSVYAGARCKRTTIVDRTIPALRCRRHPRRWG